MRVCYRPERRGCGEGRGKRRHRVDLRLVDLGELVLRLQGRVHGIVRENEEKRLLGVILQDPGSDIEHSAHDVVDARRLFEFPPK